MVGDEDIRKVKLAKVPPLNFLSKSHEGKAHCRGKEQTRIIQSSTKYEKKVNPREDVTSKQRGGQIGEKRRPRCETGEWKEGKTE